MDLIQLKIGGAPYRFLLGENCQGELERHLTALEADAYFVVTDEVVAGLYGKELCSRLSLFASSHLICHARGEEAKRLSTVEQIIERVLSLGATRRSCIVALGGGTTGNIAGLVAALLFRGIWLVHIPTTLVAILDSVISLKQAVNASRGKNLIGTFYRPEMVLADIAYLRTLPASHVRSGMCEVIKNAVAICPDEIPFLRKILNPDAYYGGASYNELVRRNVQVKAQVMEDDESEKYAGVVLEYGHTVGHAVELLSEGRLSHGEAIGLGMLVAADIARRMNRLSQSEADMHRMLLELAGAPVTLPRGIPREEIIRLVQGDNKRGYISAHPGKVPMVILEGLGRPCWTETRPLIEVPLSMVTEALAGI